MSTGSNKNGVLGGNSRSAEKFVVRLPDGMRERINTAAVANLRSMNSEIIAGMENHLVAFEGPAASSTVEDDFYPPAHLCAPVEGWLPQNEQFVWVNEKEIARINGITYEPEVGMVLHLMNGRRGGFKVLIDKVKPVAL